MPRLFPVIALLTNTISLSRALTCHSLAVTAVKPIKSTLVLLHLHVLKNLISFFASNLILDARCGGMQTNV